MLRWVAGSCFVCTCFYADTKTHDLFGLLLVLHPRMWQESKMEQEGRGEVGGAGGAESLMGGLLI